MRSKYKDSVFLLQIERPVILSFLFLKSTAIIHSTEIAHHRFMQAEETTIPYKMDKSNEGVRGGVKTEYQFNQSGVEFRLS